MQSAELGQTVTCALQNVQFPSVRTGLMLCSKEITEDPEKRGCWEFESNVRIISNHTLTIYPGYEPIVNIKTVRQACRVKELFKVNKDGERVKVDILRNRDVGIIRFRFSFRPEHISVGTRIIAREGRLRVSGKVSKIILLEDSERDKKQRRKENKEGKEKKKERKERRKINITHNQ